MNRLDGWLRGCRFWMCVARECQAPTAEEAQWQRHGRLQWVANRCRETRTDEPRPRGVNHLARVGCGPMSELMSRSALELAALVRSGELTATELVSDCLAQIDALEPTIGAFTHIAHDAALAAAAEVSPGDERPFAGVPIAI